MALSDFSIPSLDDLKAYAGIGGAGQDGNLERALNAALTVVEEITGREWVSRGSRAEYHSPTCRREKLRMSQWPVKTVTSVHESTAWPRVYDATTLLVEGTDYVVDRELGELVRISSGCRIPWAVGERSVKVVRTAGYSSQTAITGAYTVAESIVALARLGNIQLAIAAGLYKAADTRAWGDTDTTDAQGSIRRALATLSVEDREYLQSLARVEFGERTWVEAAA